MKYIHINKKRFLFIGLSMIIMIFALLQTYYFLSEFKKEEKNKMEIVAKAIKTINEAKTDDQLNLNLSQKILQANRTIPIIIVNQDNDIVFKTNIKRTDSVYLHKLILKYKNENPSFHLVIDKNQYQDLYYGRSSLYNKLTYYPLVFIGILFLFIAVIIQYYRTGKMSDENKLWSGLAKETAHQIGTPLSSLMGWVEILKVQENLDIPVEEIEKDVQRLNAISQRFSKIGSTPKLKEKDIVKLTQKTLTYIKSRTSMLVTINLYAPNSAQALVSEDLYAWVIENLVKNAIDAMQGKGKVTVEIKEEHNRIIIDVSDTGKGIPSGDFKEVFQPGYTTKKRGWGLGLSLAKRIIEQYHNGKIYVKKSKQNEGTTFRILLRK